MKKILPFLLGLVLCGCAMGQTKAVTKTVSGNNLTESFVVPSGKTITIASGATIEAAAGSTVTGFGSGGGGLTNFASTLSGGTLTFAGTLTTGRTITWRDLAGTVALTDDLSSYQPLDSDLTSIAALSTTSYGRSLLTAADASGLRTLGGLVIGTDVQAYNANTTILGSSIDLASEITGTLSLANGGTGSALTDPGADRLGFWDDSAGVFTWLTIGDNLSITGTTLNASGTGSGITALSGDVTASGTGSVAATLANTAVTAGSYELVDITVDSKGRITAANSTPTSDIDAEGLVLLEPGPFTFNNRFIRFWHQTNEDPEEFSQILLSSTAGTDGRRIFLPAVEGTLLLRPSTNGTSGQILETNGDGTTDWVDNTGGSGLTNIASTVSGGTLTLAGTLTTGRTITFPDTAGTVALTSDLVDPDIGDATGMSLSLSGGASRLNAGYVVVGDQSSLHASFGLNVGGDLGIGFSSDGTWFAAPDTLFKRDGAGLMAQRNGTNAQQLRVYETWTDASNYERLTISAASGANVIKPEAAGTGTASRVEYHTTSTGVRLMSGSGSPESSVSAPVGSIYQRTDGSTGTSIYTKETGTGNTGWVAITTAASEGGSGEGGTGDVVGPASATDDAIARYDSTTGKLLQNSLITLSDAGALTFPDDVRQTFNPGSTNAGLNVGSLSGDPSSPSNGDLWYDSTANELTARINGASVALGSGGGGLTGFTSSLLTSSPNNTVNASVLTASGGSTNQDVVLATKGTGAFIAFRPPDGTTTGGNKRGDYAVDFQGPWRNTAADVASGISSFIGNGRYNKATSSYAAVLGYNSTASGNTGMAFGYAVTASGFASVALGNATTASGAQAFVGGGDASSATAANSSAFGNRALADRVGMMALSGGVFSVQGDAQAGWILARRSTTDNTPTTLFLDGSSTRFTIPAGKVISMQLMIEGARSGGADAYRYVRHLTIKNVSGTTTLLDVVTVGTDYESNASTDVTITADDTTDSLDVKVTNIAGENWRSVMRADLVELAY